MKNANAHKFYLALAFVLIFCATCFSGCISENTIAQAEQEEYEWMDTEMTNAITGETFTFNELKQDETPIVVHLIATWCRACNIQFQESTAFLENYPGKAHIVSIGIDQNSTVIANHAISGGYGGIFTTVEAPVMQGFINHFGPVGMYIPHTLFISGDNFVDLGSGVVRSADLANRIDAILNPTTQRTGWMDRIQQLLQTMLQPTTAEQGTDWMNTEMTNVITEEKFTLRQLAKEKPTVLHLVATWCPYCQSQFKESTTFLENNPEEAHVVLIGIDLIRENSTVIADHAVNNGHAGIFTTIETPVELGLIELFGEGVIGPIPQTIIINGDNFAYLGPGVVNAADLASRIDAIS